MKKRIFTATRIIMLGFLAGAFIGSGLLLLPCCLNRGVTLSYIDSLFVATSSICVTGLSTVNIGATFSPIGQAVLLILIQLGGLGIVTFTTLLLVILHKRITLQDRLLIQSAYNLDTLSGLSKLTIRIVKVTLIIEAIGALLYAPVFIMDYGPVGIWYSVFHSVSAFCNAGIDLLGGNSLCQYRDNVLINFTTMALIIAGGLGFPVFWEIGRKFSRLKISKKAKEKAKLAGKNPKYEKRMSFHARLVIISTIVLIVLGTALTLVTEFNNPETLGGLTLPYKLQAALFQSVTLRTAGFATIDQSLFTPASAFMYIIFMFIGGSPAGTAGGVKTVTMAVLFISIFSNIRGKNSVTFMKRSISDATVRRCVSIVIFSFTILFITSGILMVSHPDDILAILYEVGSAIGTVGLSRNFTSSLDLFGKIVIAIVMYLGRIGPITFALAFNASEKKKGVSFPEEKVIIG